MKLSNRKILNDAQRLGEITQKSLPVKVSYAIAKNISKIQAELNTYNTEKEKLIEKYSQKDAEGKPIISEDNQIKLQEEHLEDWNKDINELLGIENEIDIHKFNINSLEGCCMTSAEIMLIEYMIEE